MGKFLSQRNDFDTEKAITAMVLASSLEDAVELLRVQGTTASVGVLAQIRDYERERYEKRREELAPVREGIFANDLLDNAQRATVAIGLAIGKAHQMLEAGAVTDPARLARDLSQVATQSIDKRLAVQGRPTQITEHRDVSEIVRALEAMKVVQVVDSTAEVVADGG